MPEPMDCPANPSLWTQQSPKPTPKVSLSDVLKLLGMLAVVVTGWFQLKASIAEVAQEQKFDKERIANVEKVTQSNRDELKQELKDINDKLDRIIEGRRR